ncbi:MAG: hypothetical protein RL336_1394 [Pseudomonadota bacterium]
MKLNLFAADIAARLNGRLMGENVHIDGHLNTDSRAIEAGDVFVALRGERFDGHDYLADVEAAQANLLVVSAPSPSRNVTQIVVEDTLRAYGQLAGIVRDQFSGAVFGITGSSGKTSCKEMLVSVLSECGRVHATRANYNNEIGVPLTLSTIEDGDDFAVVEMGAGKPGDIAYLVDFAQPNYALVTNVGEAHLALFESVEHIAATKKQIYRATPALQGAAINGDDPVTCAWIDELKTRDIRVMSFGLQASNDVYAKDVSLSISGCQFTLCSPQGQVAVQLSVPGSHMVMNACAVAAMASMAGVDLAVVAKGLAQYQPMKGRLATVSLAGMTLIDDSYNANPRSMCAAIDTLSLAKGRRVLVAGDMAELGVESNRLHTMVGHYAQNKVDAWFSTGSMMRYAAQAYGERATHCADMAELNATLCHKLMAGDTVLIKGSRSSGMERVVSALEQYFTEGAA